MAPTLTDFDDMVQAAFTVLPKKYTHLCDAVMIQVKDFPDQETLEKVRSKNKFGVLGTFHGRAQFKAENPSTGFHLMLTQAMLGFLPDAPRNKLYVDPLLPEWLPDITIRDLRVRHKFDIRFWREGERTEFEVLNGDASLVERCEVGVKAAQLRDRTEPI